MGNLGRFVGPELTYAFIRLFFWIRFLKSAAVIFVLGFANLANFFVLLNILQNALFFPFNLFCGHYTTQSKHSQQYNFKLVHV